MLERLRDFLYSYNSGYIYVMYFCYNIGYKSDGVLISLACYNTEGIHMLIP